MQEAKTQKHMKVLYFNNSVQFSWENVRNTHMTRAEFQQVTEHEAC